MIQNGKRHWVVSEALNCREERRRRRGRDRLVAFIWVQMEFFLNGRFESLPLSGIVWSVAEGREERDAGASAMRNQSAKALISWRHEVKGFLDCSPRIYSWFVRFPHGNCRSAVSCLFRIFRTFHFLYPFRPFLFALPSFFAEKYKKGFCLIIIPNIAYLVIPFKNLFNEFLKITPLTVFHSLLF